MILRFVGGCMRRILLLVLVAAVAAAGWHYRDTLRQAWYDLRSSREGAPLVPTAELADEAEKKLAALSGRDAPPRVALTEAEVQSLVQFRVAGVLPGYMVAPRVELDDGRMRVMVRIPTHRFPRLNGLGDVAGFLPDTTEIAATGQIIPVDHSRVALEVSEVSAAKVPLPGRLIPGILEHLGRRSAPGVPANAVALPLPPGARAAYVSGDSLVFVARRDGRSTE